MNRLFRGSLIALVSCGLSVTAAAQTAPEAPAEGAAESAPDGQESDAKPAKPADAAPDEGEKKDEESEGASPDPVDAARDAVEGAAAQGAKPEPAPREPAPAQPVEPDVPPADAESPFGDSPIAELADQEFVPLEDIEEGGLEQIVPARVFPQVEWNGSFRVRTGLAINYDLDTQGTSAVLPPYETFTPVGNPAAPDKDTHWDANLRLKLDPTLHITEQLRVHTELDLLDNLSFGTLPAARLQQGPLLGRPVADGTNFSPAQAVRVNEAYGQLDTIFGQFTAGRMDDHWGLGIYANSGDCDDCNLGAHVDRLQVQTKVWELYGAASIDFPDEGPISGMAQSPSGQPYDVSQIDDIDQYTVKVFRQPLSREERELQGKRLLDDDRPDFNGGVLYRYAKQRGAFTTAPGQELDPTNPDDLIYVGYRLHLVDAWFQLLYQPDFDTKIRVELEGVAAFGSIDNASGSAVGLPTNADDQPVNCFDENAFSSNEAQCTTGPAGEATNRDIQQFGLALETEFDFGSPIGFGLNAGLASGGPTANWGVGSSDMSFFRFSPDYHIDLITFRHVIGTVTNAYYLNPYATASFLESSTRRVEVELDAIGSRAFDLQGTPSAVNEWLGLEFDAAVRYITLDVFSLALEGGILFPFDGLDAAPGRPRYVQFGSNTTEFGEQLNARIAWTLQSKLFWNF